MSGENLKKNEFYYFSQIAVSGLDSDRENKNNVGILHLIEKL